MKEKVNAIIELLKQRYPNALCALHYDKDYELMIAVRLSAQCTDARVNLVTPGLFAAYPTLEEMANADIAHVEELVHSCGFYKHKARDIVLGCQMLLRDYGGKVPGTMEELLKIPGVGRKTANLLLGDLYAVPGSVVCDTHCIRICGRYTTTACSPSSSPPVPAPLPPSWRIPPPRRRKTAGLTGSARCRTPFLRRFITIISEKPCAVW